MYYAVPGRAPAWRRFYRQFIQPGELCFDVGAHVGNRSAAMLGIGGRVVAVEPQPLMASVLTRLYGRHERFHLVRAAVGPQPGRGEMLLSTRTPTVSTLSPEWAAEMARSPSFSGADWDQRAAVDVLTLDALVQSYGVPTFCKLDIEGFEAEALRGLSVPISAVSVEFLPQALGSAFECLALLSKLGGYEFNFIKGEYPRLSSPQWMPAPELQKRVSTLPDDGRAGEIYARIQQPTHRQVE